MTAVTLAVLLVVTGCAAPGSETPTAATPAPEEESAVAAVNQSVKHTVDPGGAVGDGPPGDDIALGDGASCISVDEADQWIQDNELGSAIEPGGEARDCGSWCLPEDHPVLSPLSPLSP